MTNVLLIVADDLRYDLLPYMPFVNETLTAEGASCTEMHAPTPICQTSRATILTGQYSQGSANGVYQNEGDPNIANESTHSLPVWCQSVTGSTQMLGKYLGGQTSTVQPGWDSWNVLNGGDQQESYDFERTNGTTETSPSGHVIDYYEGQVQAAVGLATEPFFVYYAPTNPHVNASLTNNPKPITVPRFAWKRWPYTAPAMSSKPSWMQALTAPTDSEVSILRRQIRQQIREAVDLDASIEAIYNALSVAGRLSSTLIIFTSDNGVHWGDQNYGYDFVSRKDTPYRCSTHMPCILRGPGVTPGPINGHTTLADITATICDALGATPTVTQDGQSLLDPVAADRAVLYERLGSQEATFPDARGVFCNLGRLIHYASEAGDDEWEMYLPTDSTESTNVANDSQYLSLRNQIEALGDQFGGI